MTLFSLSIRQKVLIPPLSNAMTTNSQFWIIGLILSLTGVVLIFLSWFDCQLLFVSASYDAFDMAFGDPFQSGGFWENFDPLGKYCPLLFGLVSLLNGLLFFMAKDGKFTPIIAVLSILMIVLPFYVILSINPDSGTGWERSVGVANYIGIVLGIACAIVGYLGNKASKSSS